MNNKKTAQIALAILGLSWLILFSVLTSSFFFDFEYIIIFQVSIGFLLIILTVIFSCGGYNYLEIKTEDKLNLTVKYYNLFPVGRKFKVLKISVNRIEKFEVKQYFFRMLSFIVIYELSRKGMSRYPKIGISAMKKSQKRLVVDLLNAIISR